MPYQKKKKAPFLVNLIVNYLIEALAAIKSISFDRELDLPSVIVEGDSEVAIKALRSVDESLATFGHLIASAKPSTIAFRSISFSHTRKLGNSVAHNIAKHARHANSLIVWMENVPLRFHHVFLANYDWVFFFFNKVLRFSY